MGVALQSAAPSDATQQRIWNRYNDIFTQARAFASALNQRDELPSATIPLIDGRTEDRGFNKAEIVEHLQTNADRSGLAADKAKTKTGAFDPFQGKWRGNWRQKNECGTYANIFQDHDWRQTTQMVDQAGIYAQSVLLGADSRPYASGFDGDSFTLEPGRDVDTPAVNAINIQTGVIVGAVGVAAQADDDGLRTPRPHVGFYVDDGKLLWVAEEQRTDTESVYSVFYELREQRDNREVYTIQGFEFRWHRGDQRLVGELTPKGGQYRQVLTPEEEQLLRDFNERRLRPEHLQEMRFRRQLEVLEPNVVQAFINNSDAAEQPYLTQLKAFAEQQKALREAPLGERERVVFIMGDDPFYDAAERFFQINPAGALIDNLRTLRDVRNHLNNNRPSNGRPWGEINIVSHANAYGGMSVPVVAGGQQANPQTLQAAMDSNNPAQNFPPLADGVADCRTILQVRGCSLGQSQRMVDLLGRAFGGTEVQRLQVRAPRHLQEYSFRTRNRQLTHVEQAYVQFWTVGYPDGQRPNNATLAQRFQAKYPGVPINWVRAVQRRDGFDTAVRHATFGFTFTLEYDDADPPAVGNNAERLALLQAEADLDAHVATGFELTVADFHWVFQQDIVNLGGGRHRLTLIATGVHEVFRIQRHLTMARERVFQVALNFAQELDNHTLSAALKQQFAADNRAMSDLAFVWVNEIGASWVIVDPLDQFRHVPANDCRTYFVHVNGAQLDVFLEQNPADLASTDHAHPATNHIEHFGVDIPAVPARHPLGENVAPTD